MVGTITFEPFVGDGRPGDVAAELLQFFTLIGAPAHRRMQAKAIRVDTQLWGGRADCARQALQAQHFLPSSRAERNPIGARESISLLAYPMCLTNNKVNKCIITRVSVILSNAKDLGRDSSLRYAAFRMTAYAIEKFIFDKAYSQRYQYG